MEFAFWRPYLHEETERERKSVRSQYLKILPETIRERFNLSDLSTDFLDLWRLGCPLSAVAPALKNRPRRKAR
jgi:hypothetical protein